MNVTEAVATRRSIRAFLPKPVPQAEVEIVPSSNGYWRLNYGGGWITVKRLQ